ncbi:hypothetical protein [Corynebacterium glucuronolyticum]|uniref:hypothetical protein n=1 Tax=Corynebacterium glucuronolyticum TaxID=39791 RepID=UPI00223A9F9E|nr:hypothetical protein [Corynebacterium glucuronolyticum]MCT1563152.1 hypothetical protein [Corynebacterium glucuronolyticum]
MTHNTNYADNQYQQPLFRIISETSSLTAKKHGFQLPAQAFQFAHQRDFVSDSHGHERDVRCG